MKKALRYLPIGFIGAGLVLRVLFLLNSPLWYDESFTMLIARLDIEHLLAATMGDVHPPLYYMLINGLFNLLPGANQFLLLRGFSVICSLVAMLQVWVVSGELHLSERARLIALGIMAAAPVEVYYAQEGRMYAFLQVLILAQLIFGLRRQWRDLTLVTILTLYTHNYGLFYSAVIYAVAIMRELKRERPMYRAHVDPMFEMAPFWSGVIAFGTFLPWLFFVTLGQMGMVAKGYWIQPLTLGNVLYSMLQITWTTVMPGWLIFLAAPALALLVMFATENGLKQRRFALLAMAFGPLLLAVVMSITWKPVLLFRGLFGTIPALILLLSEATERKRAWFWMSIAAPVLVIIMGWMVYQGSIGQVKGAHSNAVLPAPEAHGLLVHLNDATLLPYAVYRPDLENVYLEKGCPADHGQLSDESRAALGFKTIRMADLPEHYYLAAMVGPLSTDCEEEVFKNLTTISAPLAVDPIPFGAGETIGVNGVWSHGN
jgi:hypothetical protein